MRPPLEVIVKISKHCNLRCSYCYEFAELANRERMPLERIEQMFRSLSTYLERTGSKVKFIWHGGEPLLIKPAEYHRIGKLQREVLGPGGARIVNVTQTNLTILSETHLAWLAEKLFFSGIGVSVDPFGTQRIDIRGRLRNETVFDNMQRLIDAEIRFGAITVLSRDTLPTLERTFAFFDALGVGFRLLPFYKSISDDQFAAHALTGDEIVEAFGRVFDLWLSSRNAVRVTPLQEYLRYAMRYLGGARQLRLDMDVHESWFIVGLDGALWGQPNTYETGRAYGNLFEQDLDTILASETRRAACAEATTRVRRHCAPCPYFGHCPGDFVTYATAEERLLLKEGGCPVRRIIDHIVGRLEEAGITDRIAARPGPLQTADDEALDAAIGRA